MEVAVVVPVKRLDVAKQRLDPALTPSERTRLARWMADAVVAACAPLPVIVVCDDTDVADWAVAAGAAPHRTTATDLNGAVDDGVAAAALAGFDHVIVAHADLPIPHGLPGVARTGTITLIPDTRRDGTNVMAFPLTQVVRAQYGGGSFRRHLAAARRVAERSGVAVEVRPDGDLALDIDTVDDLRHPRLRKVLPSWLPTNPDNPSRP